jgi:geranylgeranyl diphosphate synthase, type II
MQNFEQLQLLIEQELAKINYPNSPKKLYQPIEYVLALGGKRMRPILVLMAHQLFNDDLIKAIFPALAIEVFHNFTLLHDDIMDNAHLRRGKKTVHEKWNNNVAILSGDTMLVQTYQLMCNADKDVLKDVLNVFSKAATEVCEGQQWDMDFETQSDVSLSDYMKMIENKTAVLLAASLQIGGITAGASKENQNNLYHFGLNMGIAFQLKDDLLDAFGNSETFGKQVGGDIMANKKTYLYLKALVLANPNQHTDLINYFSTTEFAEDKVEAVKSIFSALDIHNVTSELMKGYHIKAMRHLDAINSENKEPLLEFSAMLLDRVS